MSDFVDGMDLASERLGGAVVAASDDYFADKENLLRPGPAVWKEHAFTDRGKWMDGWESRRKRVPGHDWAVVRLGVPGVVRGVCVDTAFFRGNYPDGCSIEGSALPSDAPLEALLDPAAPWTEILPRSKLQGDAKNLFRVASPYAFTHLRLNIFPDGGVARLRVYGDVVPDWRRIGHARGEIDLAAAEHGGDVVSCSDMFFGERRNLVMPGRAQNMSDGWETRRRRGPGHDWAVVRLGAVGTPTRVEIDTTHFKGNFPDTCRLEAAIVAGGAIEAAEWRELLPRTKLQAHTRHLFEPELASVGPVSHVRISVFPDGGVSRLRVWATLENEARLALGVRRLDTLPPAHAEGELRSCCASTRWVNEMLALRPFGTVEGLLAAADRAWAKTGPDDWHEAFRAHPRIGETKAEAAQTRAASAWSAKEQAGMGAATDETKRALAEANRAYEAKFGFIYLVCATGLSADELLARARARLESSPDIELRTAAAEQHKITRLRLERLIEP